MMIKLLHRNKMHNIYFKIFFVIEALLCGCSRQTLTVDAIESIRNNPVTVFICTIGGISTNGQTVMLTLERSQAGNNCGVYFQNTLNPVAGKWTLKNDTLIIIPELFTYIRNNEIEYEPVDTNNILESQIQMFKVTGDKLYEITDYSEYNHASIKSWEKYGGIKPEFEEAITRKSLPDYPLFILNKYNWLKLP